MLFNRYRISFNSFYRSKFMDSLLQNLITFYFSFLFSILVKSNKLYNQRFFESERFDNDVKRYTFTYNTEGLSFLGLALNLI